ncbi:hypothetical protein [Dyella sp.]|uniref:hypothetical protein n=1 Tax=Dyella sp. TaxID=1869338 RepID=UPI002D78D783|nr:hypothetical protein [Dyella sp.]HET7332079.1 hypothetical protein [Dyella sp.]
MFIAFAGIPGIGKSSTARALGIRLDVPYFLEPAEVDWSPLIMHKDVTGHFTAMTWCRQNRVPCYVKARDIADRGGTAIVDSYFDKLWEPCMHEACFSWLIPKSDPYFEVARQMAKVDLEELPVADMLIFLKAEQSLWLRLLRTRGSLAFGALKLHQFFDMQAHMERACRMVCAAQGTRLQIIEQRWGSPEETADEILQGMKEHV